MSTKRRRIPRALTSVLVVALVLMLVACAKDENEKLIKASKEGRLEEVTRLLNSGADVNAKGSPEKNCPNVGCREGSPAR